jgi:hypothetical protein
MRSIQVLCFGALLVLAGRPLEAEESPLGKTTIAATADVRHRTGLVVSSDVLHFHVTDAGQPAEVVVTFSAGARTASTADVLLFVTALNAHSDPSLIGTALTISSGTSEAVTGPVTSDGPSLAAQWIGGGLRNGRIHFQLRAAPGTYVVPVRFLLTAP